MTANYANTVQFRRQPHIPAIKAHNKTPNQAKQRQARHTANHQPHTPVLISDTFEKASPNGKKKEDGGVL